MTKVAGPDTRPSEGFTLIEVLVSLVLLSIVALGLASALMASMSQSARLQHRQVAAQLASRQLQAVQAVDATYNDAGCTKLVQGRTQQTAAALNASAVALNLNLKSDAAWNKGECPTSPVIIPGTGLIGATGSSPQNPVTINGIDYQVNTIVGLCAVVNGSGCVPASAASQSAHRVYEVLVWVTWNERYCPGSTCTVDLSTIIDPRVDPAFNIRSAATASAKADSFCILRNVPAAINVLANDVGSLGETPVEVTTPVNSGTLGDIKRGVGSYTPRSNYTGTATFSYRLIDVNGIPTTSTTVTLTIASSC